jgi:hypothetical protein
LAGLAEEPRQARGRAQLEQLGVLITRHFDRAAIEIADRLDLRSIGPDRGIRFLASLCVSANRFRKIGPYIGPGSGSNRLIGAAKMSQRTLMISLRAKTHISLTTVAGQSSMHFLEGLKTWSSPPFYLSLLPSQLGQPS